MKEFESHVNIVDKIKFKYTFLNTEERYLNHDIAT